MKKTNYVKGKIDCHTHSGGIDVNNFYNSRYPSTQDISILNRIIQKNNVDFAITFPMPSSLYYNVRHYWENGEFISSGFSDYPFELENEYLLKEIECFGFNNILPFLSFSLQDKVKEQCQGLTGLINKYPIYGLKFHTKADQNSISDLKERGIPFIELAQANNLPFVIHTEKSGVASPMPIFELALQYPELRFSLAHFAGFSKEFYNELDEYNKNYRNIFIDSAPTLFLTSHISVNDGLLDLDYSEPKAVLRYFLNTYNDSFLWGTDTPWLMSSGLDNRINHFIDYSDEKRLRDELEYEGYAFSANAVNNFLFGVSAAN